MRRTTWGIAAAALFIAGFFFAGFFSVGGGLNLSPADGDRPGQDTPEVATAQTPGPASGEPRLPPPETFARIFEPCAHCHQIGDGARASSGPVLTGVVGRPAAATDYPYSRAMKRSGVVWDEATLREFLADPAKVVPGNRMIFRGLEDDKIEPLIDFLKNPRADGSEISRSR